MVEEPRTEDLRKITVATYNIRGLRLGQTACDKSSHLVLENLLEVSDIVCLQETWPTKQDLVGLNTISANFHGIGESTTDLNDKIVHGSRKDTWWCCHFVEYQI